MQYPAESAGGLMDTAVTVFSADETAEDALNRIRSFPERRVHDLCVADSDGLLTAVVPLQEVAVAQPGDRLGGAGKGQAGLRAGDVLPRGSGRAARDLQACLAARW